MAVLQPGMFVIKCKPFVHVLSGAERNNRCDECLNCADQLLRCSACHLARFCSKRCQRQAWLVHKEECKCLQRVAPRIPTDSVRLFFRLLLRLEEHIIKVDEFLDVKRSFADLESHVEEIRKDAKRMEEFLQLCQTLRVFVGENWTLPVATDLLQTFGKMVINTFSICDGEMQAIGVGIYLGASYMDHSCQPNAVAVFNGTELYVRNTVVIDTSQPIKFHISYIDQLLPRRERQEQLVKQYYFTCDCPACRDDHQDAMMMAIKCPAENCHGAVMPREDGSFGPCDSCKGTDLGAEYVKEHTELVAHSQVTLERVKQLKLEKDFEVMMDMCEECLERQRRLLHPLNIYVVQVTDSAFDAAIQLYHWDKAVDYGSRTLEPYRRYYPTNHPNVGIQLMKVGKIQMLLQGTIEAITLLIEAESILQVTHGKDHPLYTELARLLDQCTAELKQ